MKSRSRRETSRFSNLYPFTSHFFERNGLKYRFIDEGTGVPIVRLHGNPTWSFYLRTLVEAFSSEYRTIVLLGSGRDIFLIFTEKGSINRCFRGLYCFFQGQNRPNKKPLALETDMYAGSQRFRFRLYDAGSGPALCGLHFFNNVVFTVKKGDIGPKMALDFNNFH